MKSTSAHLPRVYLDSDALIKAKIECLPRLASHAHLLSQQPEVLNEIPAATELLESWNPTLLYASMHTLMETLNCAIRTYGLPLDEAGRLLADSCGRDFTILFGKFELMGRRGNLVELFENRIPDSAIYSKMGVHGQAVNPDGTIVGPVSQGATLASGALVESNRTGSLFAVGPGVTIGDIDSHWISSPKLERELFLRAIELSQAHGLLPKDTIHLAFAQGQVEYVVTTDSAFLAALQKHQGIDLPRGAKPTELLDQYRRFL